MEAINVIAVAVIEAITAEVLKSEPIQLLCRTVKEAAEAAGRAATQEVPPTVIEMPGFKELVREALDEIVKETDTSALDDLIDVRIMKTLQSSDFDSRVRDVTESCLENVSLTILS